MAKTNYQTIDEYQGAFSGESLGRLSVVSDYGCSTLLRLSLSLIFVRRPESTDSSEKIVKYRKKENEEKENKKK